MGYTTNFHGAFSITPPLQPLHRTYLRAFAETRHCQRVAAKELPHYRAMREAVGLPFGHQGEYGLAAMSEDFREVENYNETPSGQPGLWCNWTTSSDGTRLRWNGAEKFYHYAEWLTYLIERFFKPWGYTVSGQICYSGEDCDDFGWITVQKNCVHVSAYEGEPVLSDEGGGEA